MTSEMLSLMDRTTEMRAMADLAQFVFNILVVYQLWALGKRVGHRE